MTATRAVQRCAPSAPVAPDVQSVLTELLETPVAGERPRVCAERLGGTPHVATFDPYDSLTSLRTNDAARSANGPGSAGERASFRVRMSVRDQCGIASQ